MIMIRTVVDNVNLSVESNIHIFVDFLSIWYRKLVDASSVRKGEFTSKYWYRIDVDNSMSIRLSKSMKYQ